jgi:hypothetical protein
MTQRSAIALRLRRARSMAPGMLMSLIVMPLAVAAASQSTAGATVTPDPNAGISAVVQVCTLAAVDYCDPTNNADWTSTDTVYNATVRWRVVITNTGTDPLINISASSSLPSNEEDCAGPVSAGPLDGGGVIQYECQSNNVAQGTTISQTITVSGEPPTGPSITSASSTASAQVLPDTPPPGAGISALLQICTLANQAACDPTNSADWTSIAALGQTTARWRVVVTNTGSLPLTSIYVTDTLAQTDCGGFVTSSLAPGGTAEYECQTNNVVQTVVNSATATGNPPAGAPVTSSPSFSIAIVKGATPLPPPTFTPPPFWVPPFRGIHRWGVPPFILQINKDRIGDPFNH